MRWSDGMASLVKVPNLLQFFQITFNGNKIHNNRSSVIRAVIHELTQFMASDDGAANFSRFSKER